MIISFDKLIDDYGADIDDKDLLRILESNLEETSKYAFWFMAMLIPITSIFFQAGNYLLSIEPRIDNLYFIALYMVFIVFCIIYYYIIKHRLTGAKMLIYTEYIKARKRLKEINNSKEQINEKH